MSRSSDATSPRDFWSATARLGAAGAPRLAWQTLAGEDFPLLAPFLIHANGPLARAVPCPVCGCSRRISELPEGSLLMEVGEYCAGCGDATEIPRDHITPTALNLPHFARAAGTALHFSADTQAEAGSVIPLGTVTQNAKLLPVALVLLPRAPRDDLDSALARVPAPAVLLLAAPTGALLSELRARRYSVFPAAAILQPKPKGAFRSGKPLAALVAEADGGAPLRPMRDPLPMRGKRYEIAEGFVAITKLGKKPVRYPISQPKAQALLRALVESGAGSEATSLDKRALLAIVYGGEAVPDVRPSQLLRYTGPNGTQPLPFRDDILRHSRAGGRYWLEL